MSIHKSLRVSKSMARTRNVMTRWERVLRLREEGRWTDGGNVLGLPKTRIQKVKVGGKKKKKGPAEGEAAAEKK